MKTAEQIEAEDLEAGYYGKNLADFKIDDRWIPLSERLPDRFPCQIYNSEFGVAVANFTTDYLGGFKITHWKPLKLSDPPEPEVSDQRKADEAAFDEWWRYTNVRSRSIIQDAWHAALAWERGRK